MKVSSLRNLRAVRGPAVESALLQIGLAGNYDASVPGLKENTFRRLVDLVTLLPETTSLAWRGALVEAVSVYSSLCRGEMEHARQVDRALVVEARLQKLADMSAAARSDRA